ncbi:MAG: colanic acid biosynthesis glycosyltransferase WcaI [Winogradskyella sp.]|uniref:WcaI family glycosyltransferase n=1 Tax=Winogradskyella poriferorum TaxID=307627 RepID=A0ABU7W2Q9_9FLAO|nr:colanic acid biosynthesis glycosyltransferase WcaI [Winogradskyella sp.]|tara:strand:+ start:54 stop:1271 length:1218 start_codon:yes stop_codon:yes gene_type:complete
MKNITIIGVNYYPEDSAIGLYSTQKAEYLSSKGFNVSVITGFPYYPHWKINKDYIDKNKFLFEEINGVKVYRYKQYVPENPTFIKRIKHIISFTKGSYFNLKKVEKPDLVISIVPFTSGILLGWLLKRKHKSRLWVHIQDFEFDAAFESGLISKNKAQIFKLLFNIERFLLKKADVISTISNGMLSKLKSKVSREGYYLTNWLDTSKFQMEFEEAHPFLNDAGKFKILYSGNIGAKQDWEVFFSFLDKLKGHDDVEVVVVGEGANRKQVQSKLNDYDFASYYQPVPFEDLPKMLKSADLHVLFQKDDVIDTVMPSKILGMMGSGKPSLVTGNMESEVKQIFDKSSAGFYFSNNQIDEMEKTVLELKENKSLQKQLGESAKNFVIDNYSKHVVLDNFIKEINSLLK